MRAQFTELERRAGVVNESLPVSSSTTFQLLLKVCGFRILRVEVMCLTSIVHHSRGAFAYERISESIRTRATGPGVGVPMLGLTTVTLK